MDQAAAEGAAQDPIDSVPLPFERLGGQTWRPRAVPSWQYLSDEDVGYVRERCREIQ